MLGDCSAGLSQVERGLCVVPGRLHVPYHDGIALSYRRAAMATAFPFHSEVFEGYLVGHLIGAPGWWRRYGFFPVWHFQKESAGRGLEAVSGGYIGSDTADDLCLLFQPGGA